MSKGEKIKQRQKFVSLRRAKAPQTEQPVPGDQRQVNDLFYLWYPNYDRRQTPPPTKQ